MLTGIALGLIMRKHPFRFTSQLSTVLIWTLLFMLGVSIGCNETLFDSITEIGLKSAVIGTSTAIASAAASWILWRYIINDKT